MGLVHVDTVFESVTGMPEDRFVHTLNFRWDGPVGPTDSELGELADVLTTLYNTPPTGEASDLANDMSHEISRAANASQHRIYRVDVVGDPLGSPDLVRLWTLDPGDAAQRSLPAEVAVVLSQNASLVDVPEEVGTTRPASRRRGRVYFGPLNARATDAGPGAAAVQRPGNGFLARLRQAYIDMAQTADDIMNLNAGLFWSVYSREDNALRTVINVSTDDAFDTQRRRGADAAARTNEATGL
jgi:hypothetical protein